MKPPSAPVDLYQVSARLLQLCAENKKTQSESSVSPGKSPPLWSGFASPLSAEEQFLQNLAYERRFHSKLIKHHSQPWYRIDLIDKISKNPGEHRHVLKYWQGEFSDENRDAWMVFGQQWERWKRFREWQTRMRTKFEGRMPTYIDRTRRQLEKHSFTHPFEFNLDPKKQDKLTTWVEYMSYEYMRYDRVLWYRRREDWYKAAWTKLTDSEVLEPHETQAYIHSKDCSALRQAEAVDRRQAVEEARSAVLLAHRDLLDPSIPSPTAQESLAVAQEQLDSAIQAFEIFKRRNDLIDEFVRTTEKYHQAKIEAERHVLLLDWMRLQVPLIKQEMGSLPDGDNGVDDEEIVHTGEGESLRESEEQTRSSSPTIEEEVRHQRRKRGGGHLPTADAGAIKRSRKNTMDV